MYKQNVVIIPSFPEQGFSHSFNFQGLFHKNLKLRGCPFVAVVKEPKLRKSRKKAVMGGGVGSAEASAVFDEIVPEPPY